MDTKKYKDMAYSNSIGKRWLEILFREDIWNMWVQRVKQFERDPKIKKSDEYPNRIVIEAIWHLGYAEDLGNPLTMSRCLRRLHTPPDRGEGVDKKGCAQVTSANQVYMMPWEFKIFDEFLEHFVRPLI